MTDPDPQPRLSEVTCLSPGGLHRFAYAEWGDPKNDCVLVCVHGLTRSGRDFDPLARALASHYRVVCPDIVGRGRSGWLRDPASYTVTQYVSDCVTLLAKLDAKLVHWVGTSMGGLIGMGLASLPGNPIARLVLNDIAPILEEVAVRRIESYVGAPPRFSSFDEGVRYVSTVNAPFGTHSVEQWRALARNVLVQDGTEWRYHFDPALVPAFIAHARTITRGGALATWDGYDAITCPTLAIRGALSDLLSAELHAELALRGPRATLAIIPDVGHAPTLMHDDQIALVRAFLLD